MSDDTAVIVSAAWTVALGIPWGLLIYRQRAGRLHARREHTAGQSRLTAKLALVGVSTLGIGFALWALDPVAGAIGFPPVFFGGLTAMVWIVERHQAAAGGEPPGRRRYP